MDIHADPEAARSGVSYCRYPILSGATTSQENHKSGLDGLGVGDCGQLRPLDLFMGMLFSEDLEKHPPGEPGGGSDPACELTPSKRPLVPEERPS